mgnify:CR=1 FL=1
MRNVGYNRLGPFVCLVLTVVILCHGAVGGIQVAGNDMRTGEAFEKTADATATDRAVQAGLHIVGDGDRELLHGIRILYVKRAAAN